MNAFARRVVTEESDGLSCTGIELLQVNVGLRCNQACEHCHLGASPERPEVMAWPTMRAVLAAAKAADCARVDITGGEPALNPNLKRFIAALREQGRCVQVRTNLTSLVEPEQAGMAAFFAEHRVDLVASMPCYREENVTAQRGPGVYTQSVAAIRALNALGYGERLQLNLVYNPGGPFLPPDQEGLEADYKRELKGRFGIVFSSLLTLANMPLGRFRETLTTEGAIEDYEQLLQDSFNPATLAGLMCRRQVSIGWDGTLYDCDFNLALGLPVDSAVPDHVTRFDAAALARRRIVTGEHCFACTAGCGSSCAGALV